MLIPEVEWGAEGQIQNRYGGHTPPVSRCHRVEEVLRAPLLKWKYIYFIYIYVYMFVSMLRIPVYLYLCQRCSIFTYIHTYIYFYYTALQNVPKSSVDLNGPSQRSQVCNFFIFTAAKNVWLLSLATGFVLLIIHYPLLIILFSNTVVL